MNIHIKRISRKLTFVIVFFTVSSCGSFGPVNEPNYLALLEEAIGIDKDEIILNSEVNWRLMYGDQCWTNTKHCSALQITNAVNPLLSATHSSRSILVLEESSLFILDWDVESREYVKNTTLLIDNIISLEMYAKRNKVRIGVIHKPSKFYIIHTYRQLENTGKLFDYLKDKVEERGVKPISFK